MVCVCTYWPLCVCVGVFACMAVCVMVEEWMYRGPRWLSSANYWGVFFLLLPPSPFSHPPESILKFPSEEQVIMLPRPPSPPTSPLLSLSLPSLPALRSLSFSRSLPLHSIPFCPNLSPQLTAFPSLSFSGCMKGAPCGHREDWWKKSKQR